jgi:hypothetical protein
MRWADRKAAKVVAGLIAVVGGGYITGRWLDTPACLDAVGTASLLAAALALAAVLRRPHLMHLHTAGRIAGGGLLVYLILAVIFDPFARVWDAADVVTAVGCLSPLALGAVILPLRCGWRAGLAC